MDQLKNLGLVFLIIAALVACKKDQDDGDGLFISPTERAILDNCIEQQQFQLKEDIETNLIGTWKLVGYGCGFCAPHQPPSAHLTFTEQQGTLVYQSGQQDTTIVFQWSVEPTQGFSSQPYTLQTDPLHFALHLDHFCPNYIFFDHTAFDGQMFLYRKE